MPTPRADSYITASGHATYGGRSAPPPSSSLPAWVASQPLNQWFNPPASNLTSLTSSAGPVGPTLMNDYSGTVIADGKLYAFGGGHGGGTDNTVARYDLTAGTGWEVFCQPTPIAQRVFAVTGDTNLSKFWWGDPGNLKPNPPHTYSSAQWVPSLNKIIWFGQRGPYHYSGNISPNRLLQLKLASATWTQPFDADDVQLPPFGLATVQLPDGKILGSSSGSTIFQFDPAQPVGSQFSTWTSNGALNWNGYGQYLLDLPHNRIIRVGNGYGSALYVAVDLATKAVTNIKPLLNGDPSVLMALDGASVADTVGACIDPINNRIVVPITAAGGSFYAIDLETFAVTVVSPSIVAGSNVSAAPTSAGIFGRVHYYAPLKLLIYNPNGNAPMCAMRLG